MRDAVGYSSGGVRFYKHSGRVPVAAGVAGVLVGLGVGVVLGAAEGALGLWSHLVGSMKLSLLLEILLVMGFGFGVGVIPMTVLRKMKARSVPAAVAVAAIGVGVGYYVAWVFWSFALMKYWKEDFTLLEVADPRLLSQMVQSFYEGGVWYIASDAKPTGLFLALIWLAELITVGWIAVSTAAKGMRKAVFCDQCNQWGTRRDLMQLSAGNLEAVKAGVAGGNLEVLAGIPRRAAGDGQWCDVYLEGCPGCGELQTLSVTSTVETVDKKGKRTVKTTPVVRRMVLSPEQAVQVAGIAGGV